MPLASKSLETTDFLLVDIGNTRLKWACSGPEVNGLPALREGLLVGKPARPDKRAIRALAKRYPMHWVMVACVVPSLRGEVERAFANQPLHILSGESPYFGFDFTYPAPLELGADRLADAAALFELGQFPAISINCGTATVLNALDYHGRFCGGLIQPGLDALQDALIARAAGLKKVKSSGPSEADLNMPGRMGRSTLEAIVQGTLSVFRGGAIEGLNILNKEFGSPAHVYLTGGNAPYLGWSAEEEPVQRDAPWKTIKTKALLTLEGLNILAHRWRATQ